LTHDSGSKRFPSRLISSTLSQQLNKSVVSTLCDDVPLVLVR
jgi:hypothetical protein